MSLTFYELGCADRDRRFSPFCWRTRLALAHKGLQAETVPCLFTEKHRFAASGQDKVPVLEHDGHWVHDSWTIANYLEDTFPDCPTLFGGAQGHALSRLHDSLANALNAQVIRIVLLDIYNHLDEADKSYFRESREKRFGMTLEAVVADREERVQAFRQALMPLRLTLAHQPYFGGDNPLYGDYALFSVFQWARTISDFPLLESDDVVTQWCHRVMQAHDGLAGKATGYAL